MSDSHVFKIIKPTDSENDRILINYYVSSKNTNNFIEVDGKFIMRDLYIKFSKIYDNFEVKNSDVFVISFPKTGTTWTQEMVWMIMNNLDFEAGKKRLDERFPHFEVSSLVGEEIRKYMCPEYTINDLITMEDPRLIKSHLPWDLLPKQIQNNEKQPKIIYVMRNPKDACVSYYYYLKTFGSTGTIEEFTKIYTGDRIIFGSFWTHVLSFWKNSDRKNILFITYEQMIKDLPTVIRHVSEFLGKTLSEEQISKLSQHLSFQSMKSNKSVNYDWMLPVTVKKSEIFIPAPCMRSGEVGNYKSDMSPEIIAKFDAWNKEKLNGIDFPYPELLK